METWAVLAALAAGVQLWHGVRLLRESRSLRKKKEG